MDAMEEKTIKRTTIFEGKVVNLYLDEVSLPNGKTSTREIVDHPGAVGIIPLTEENKIVLVEQFRKPLERSLWEIPAGKLEKGEDPLDTARRELEEETGYQAGQWEHIASFYTSPGFSNELLHIYVAKGLKKGDGKAIADEDEFVNVGVFSLEEVLKMVKEQKIFDAKTLYAVQHWKMVSGWGIHS
jgi:nudix hydrolase, YffH family